MKHIRFSYIGFCGSALTVCLLLSACKQSTQEQRSRDVARYVSTDATNGANETCHISTKYAEGFKVKNAEGGVRLVDIQNPQEPKSTVYQFALRHRSKAVCA